MKMYSETYLASYLTAGLWSRLFRHALLCGIIFGRFCRHRCIFCWYCRVQKWRPYLMLSAFYHFSDVLYLQFCCALDNIKIVYLCITRCCPVSFTVGECLRLLFCLKNNRWDPMHVPGKTVSQSECPLDILHLEGHNVTGHSDRRV